MIVDTILAKIFGTKTQREIKGMWPIVAAINDLEPGIRQLSDIDLAAKTIEFREKIAQGATLDDLLIEAFAVVREAGRRFVNMRHFDVQLIGGKVLHSGRIAEMKTGEGKTLVATLPCYLNALAGKGVHVVTVNDYLARRDSEWMGRQFLGPPLGSALFAFLLPLPFWFDAVTYTLSLLLIYRIRDTAGRFQPQRPVRDPGAAPARRALLAEATEGLRYMARHRVLRVIVALAATSNFAVYMALSVLVLYAEEVLRVGSRGYGVLVAAMAVGGVLGALVSRRVVVSLGPRVVAIGVSLASALSLIAIGLFGHSPVTVAALFCIWSAGLSIWNVMAQTLSLQLVPDELRGRVPSGSRMAAFGALPLGALAGGFVAGAYGLRAPWLVGGLVHLTVALIFLPALLRLPQVTPVRASESEASD